MRRKWLLVALSFVAAGGALLAFAPRSGPPDRIWARYSRVEPAPEARMRGESPLGVVWLDRLADRPGGEAIAAIDLSGGHGAASSGGNVVHIFTVTRGAVGDALDRLLGRDPEIRSYAERRVAIRHDGAEWRELIHRTGDGVEPPVPGGAALAGRWEHTDRTGRKRKLTLRADGTLDIADGAGSWTRTGATLVLEIDLYYDGLPHTLDDAAVCTLAADERTYAGRDVGGRTVSGARAP